MEENNRLSEMLKLFRTEGTPVRCALYGSGYVKSDPDR